MSILGDIMKNINKNLSETTGLSEKKAKIYLGLLELGSGTVIEIAKKTGLKRTTVYNLLPEMFKSGLISTAIQKKKRIFLIDDVRNLTREIEDKKRQVEKMIPELEAIHNLSPLKPKVTYYEGPGGLRELYNDTLESCSPGDTICSFIGVKNWHDLMPPDFVAEYVEKRVKKKIRTRVIAPRFKASEELADDAQKKLREIKIINNPEFGFQAGTEIYANKVALISYKEDFMGVVIESKEISQMHKSAFEVMWNSL
jgi:sugar-specific transcriptional regulator TrmB